MKNKYFSPRGQTLIEILIAIAIGTIVVAAVLALATRSNRNANFSRASSQASKLTQQGLELIKNIRSENGEILNLLGCSSPCNWSDLYGINLTEETGFFLVPNGVASCTAKWCLDGDAAGSGQIDIDGQIFERKVLISDTPTPLPGKSNCNDSLTVAEAKQVEVIVSWDDPTGTHDTSAVSCLNNL